MADIEKYSSQLNWIRSIPFNTNPTCQVWYGHTILNWHNVSDWQTLQEWHAVSDSLDITVGLTQRTRMAHWHVIVEWHTVSDWYTILGWRTVSDQHLVPDQHTVPDPDTVLDWYSAPGSNTVSDRSNNIFPQFHKLTLPINKDIHLWHFTFPHWKPSSEINEYMRVIPHKCQLYPGKYKIEHR